MNTTQNFETMTATELDLAIAQYTARRSGLDTDSTMWAILNTTLGAALAERRNRKFRALPKRPWSYLANA